MPPFPPLFLVQTSCCLLIRRLTPPWTYRAVFFTGYEKAQHLDCLRFKARLAKNHVCGAEQLEISFHVDFNFKIKGSRIGNFVASAPKIRIWATLRLPLRANFCLNPGTLICRVVDAR
jgi:hypothetical protein